MKWCFERIEGMGIQAGVVFSGATYVMAFVDGGRGIWGIRICDWWACVKAPWNEPLFSERYGYEKPRLRMGGWRLFARKMRAAG